jgi:hypothetical protein
MPGEAMIKDLHYTRFRPAVYLISIARCLWYSPAIHIALVRVLT